MNAAAHTQDPVAKAVTMLLMLDEGVRQQVLDRMSPDMRERVMNRLSTMPTGSSSMDVLAKRDLLRQTAQNLADRRIQAADDMLARDDHAEGAPMAMPQARAAGSGTAGPIDQLRGVHPAALARALQGERAEAWALVLERIDERTRQALEQHLDAAARASIASARQRLQQVHPTLLATIERAIVRTVVPQALREQRLLVSPYPAGAHHGTAV